MPDCRVILSLSALDLALLELAGSWARRNQVKATWQTNAPLHEGLFSFYVSFSYCTRFLFFVTYIIVIYTLTNYLLSISSIKDVVELLDNSLLKSPKNRISSTGYEPWLTP